MNVELEHSNVCTADHEEGPGSGSAPRALVSYAISRHVGGLPPPPASCPQQHDNIIVAVIHYTNIYLAVYYVMTQ